MVQLSNIALNKTHIAIQFKHAGLH